jgi:SAM-dependent methyltransferase
MTDYETIPYASQPVPAAHPWRMLWTSTVFGGPRPDLRRARVLEIGCGDGSTILPVAAFEPEWTILGVDSSPRALADAVRMTQAAGLTNVSFVKADLASIDIEPGAWDIVIAHGLYSWVDRECRAALRRLLRRALAPDGLAYISFNALPGWSVRGRMRDIILRDPGRSPDDHKKLLQALEQHAGSDAWGQLLAKELRRARNAPEFYFLHEYCASSNDAFWVVDFIHDAAGDGLRWVADTQFDLREGRGYEQLRAVLDEAVPGLPRVRSEELVDLVGYRQFRCAVLARDDAPSSSPPLDDAAAVRAAIISGRIAPPAEPVDYQTANAQTFRSADGEDIEVDEPLGKAALTVLGRHHPDGFRYGDLIQEARQMLAMAGANEISADAAREVAEGVARLWRVGALQLRLQRPRLAVARPERPKVVAFAQAEARFKNRLTHPLGELLPITPSHLNIIGLIDGTRTEADLVDAYLTMAPRDDAEFVSRAPAEVRETIAMLSRWGLLEEAAG